MIHKDNGAQGTTNRRVAMFNGKRLSGWMALAVFATVGGAMVAADPAFAKVDVDKLTIGGEIRERYEFRTNATFNAGQGRFGTAPFASTGGAVKSQKGNESLASHRVRVNVGYDLTPDVSFFVQIADARAWGSEGFSTANFGSSGAQTVSQTNSQLTGVDLHQAHITLRNVLVPGLSLKAGRQEIIFGDHRLFGNFGWSQVGNSFDAVRLTHSTQMADVDLFWARIIDNAAVGFQNSNNNIPFPAAAGAQGNAQTGATQATGNQDIYGLYITLKPVKNWTIEPYWFLLQDARATQVNATAAVGGASFATTPTFSSILQAQAPSQTRNTLGARLNGKQGGLDFTYEGVYQFGSITSQCQRSKTRATCGSYDGGNIAIPLGSVQGTRDSHINANAHAVRTGFTFDAVPMKPRLGFEFDYASGDKCANGPNGGVNSQCNGATHFNTFDNLYPTNHFHYGYMDLMAWKNMVNYQANFAVNPSPASKLQFNFIWHRLANTQDNWYRAGQATYFTSKFTNQAASLGRELDIHYWHTFKEKFKFELGYGHFWAGEYLTKSASGSSITGEGGFANSQGSFSNGFGNGTQITGQNWGYVMGSILF